MSQLQLQFNNQTSHQASEIYIGFVTGSSTAVDLINLKTKAALQTVDAGITNQPGPGTWYSLSQLNQGVGINSFSGRIYFCYGTPWRVQRAGYEPAQAVTDPNFYLRYDKMEITFTGSVYDVANLTSIDYWSIPLNLATSLQGNPVGKVNGLNAGVTAQQVYDALNALTQAPRSGLSGPGGVDGQPLPALVPGEFQQYGDGPKPGKGFSRIIGPSSYPPAFPPPGAIPVMPYDLLQAYLKDLHKQFGPGTQVGAVVPGLGNGVIATIQGQFAGVGPVVPATGPQSAQSYNLTASIDASLNLTLSGKTSAMGQTKMLFALDDLLNPSGIYGGNAPFALNGGAAAAPANDVYGWISGDLFAGLNIGAVGSSTLYSASPGTTPKMVGSMASQQWFEIPPDQLFASLQPTPPAPGLSNYNRWAATLQGLSQAYNFAYTDRFAPVFVGLNPADVDTLQVTLAADQIKM